MKSFLLYLLTFLLLGYANAQVPTLTSADIFKAGDVLAFQDVYTVNVNTPSTGANQIWNYSGIVDTVGNEVDSFVSPAATPYASLFPGTNLALTLPTVSGGGYAYYQTNANNIFALGDFLMSDTLYYSKPFTVFHYPFTYNSFFVDSAIQTIHFTGGQQTLTNVDSISGVGYGTLILPGHTYTNVLEVKIINAEQSDFGSFSNTTIYFFKPGYTWALFQIDVDNNGAVTGARYSINPITVPLTWLSFNVKAIAASAALTWQTADNVNTSNFSIEKSNDGINFSSVKQVSAATGTFIYTATDDQPFDGINYYRIKQVDKDGSYSYSSTVHVSCIKKAIINITPTIVQGQSLTLTSNRRNASKAQLYIINAEGKLLMKHQINIEAGLTSQQINIHTLSAGCYFITVNTDEGKKVMRFIKK